ncbi:MAG: hypothetical protein ABSH52_24655 [Terriglobia bacterium]|jgi:rubrerythrin
MSKNRKAVSAAAEKRHLRDLAELFERVTKQLDPDFDFEKVLGRKPETPDDISLALRMDTADIREDLRILKGGKPH